MLTGDFWRNSRENRMPKPQALRYCRHVVSFASILPRMFSLQVRSVTSAEHFQTAAQLQLLLNWQLEQLSLHRVVGDPVPCARMRLCLIHSTNADQQVVKQSTCTTS